MQPGDVPLTYASIAKAASRLGYAPTIDIRQGIPLFVEWFRAHARTY
jgi:nucleoside-diphosphate-sugar epimerase